MEKVIILIITGIGISLTSFVPIIITDVAKKSKSKDKLTKLATFFYIFGFLILIIELSIILLIKS